MHQCKLTNGNSIMEMMLRKGRQHYNLEKKVAFEPINIWQHSSPNKLPRQFSWLGQITHIKGSTVHSTLYFHVVNKLTAEKALEKAVEKTMC